MGALLVRANGVRGVTGQTGHSCTFFGAALPAETTSSPFHFSTFRLYQDRSCSTPAFFGPSSLFLAPTPLPSISIHPSVHPPTHLSIHPSIRPCFPRPYLQWRALLLVVCASILVSAPSLAQSSDCGDGGGGGEGGNSGGSGGGGGGGGGGGEGEEVELDLYFEKAVGFGAVLAEVTLSGFASIYFEVTPLGPTPWIGRGWYDSSTSM